MHERELRGLVSIADIGWMDHAAEYLGYSQPAVGYQIKCIEQALGTRLFDCDSTGARLTREGRMILPLARAMLSLFESIKSVAGV